MQIPPNYSPYMCRFLRELDKALEKPTFHFWGRTVIVVSKDHAWLLRDELAVEGDSSPAITITYMSPEATSIQADEDPILVVGMILAAME